MTFPGRRRMTSRGSFREGKESLLLHPEHSSASSNPIHSGSASTSSSGGSDSFEVTVPMSTTKKNNRLLTRKTSFSSSPPVVVENSRIDRDSRFLPQHHPTSEKEEIPPAPQGVLQFVPAFDDSIDTSWDAILQEGAAAFPPQPSNKLMPGRTKSEVGATTSAGRFGRKAQSTVGGRSPAVVSSSLASRRSVNKATESSLASSSLSTRTTTTAKGPRIARLASLFSGNNNNNNNNNTRTTSTFGKKSSPNTTDTTLPSSPSRSSSSGGYVNWPNTLNKQGDTVAIPSSYEESDSGPDTNHDNPGDLPFVNYEDEQAWMESSAFQDISGVTPDPPSPPGRKADDSIYFENNNSNNDDDDYHYQGDNDDGFDDTRHSIPMDHLFRNTPGWEVDSSSIPSPSRSIRSKTSSAYFDNNDHVVNRPMAFPSAVQQEEERKRKQAAAVVMRGVVPPQHALSSLSSSSSSPITKEALAINNSFTPPHRTFNVDAVRGYSGLLNKTQDVPNLMDAVDSDSMASSRTSSAVPSVSTTSGPVQSPYHQNKQYQSNNSYNQHGSHPYGSGSRLSGGGRSMPRVHEEEFVARDSESDVFDEISKYSIGAESEPFEGISQSDSKPSSYEIQDLHPFESVPKHQSVVEESKASLHDIRTTTSSVEQRYRNNDKQQRAGAAASAAAPSMKVVLLGGGLTTIQTTTADFSNRITASDYDECLTNSDIDEYGSTKLPSFQEMAAAGRGVNDSASAIGVSLSVDPSSQASREEFIHDFAAFDGDNDGRQRKNTKREPNQSETSYKDDESAFFSDFYSGDEVEFDGDLSEYYVQPSSVKKLVRKYRKMCRTTIANCQDDDELDRAEDEKKIFALFEMRSRIMEKDIERGLERRGGTAVVDDLVTTDFYRRSMRIRDAVIVSKAWRDGASPMDVINTAILTQRAERSYYIKRPIVQENYRSPNKSLNDSMTSTSYRMQRYRWEQVTWVDDTDFIRYSCPSLGPRTLRGSEMFTIGDCQSILLKLTNESCMELRAELNMATARQIEAEEIMKEEGDYGDGMMTEAEMTYLSSMEEVKTISKQLVVAEKAFALVRDRIRNLVAKYESLLVKIDNEDMATSSVITAESSCYSDAYSSRVSTDYDQEEQAWYRRQRRAEITAELAAREALLAKQSDARSIQEEKQRELRDLQLKLAELQSEPSTTTSDRQRSAVLAKAIAARQHSFSGRQGHNGRSVNGQQSKVDEVKQKFRDRMAARLRQHSSVSGSNNPTQYNQAAAPQHNPHNAYYRRNEPRPEKRNVPSGFDKQKLIRLAGEEMFQHLDFYERSLKAVENHRGSSR